MFPCWWQTWLDTNPSGAGTVWKSFWKFIFFFFLNFYIHSTDKCNRCTTTTTTALLKNLLLLSSTMNNNFLFFNNTKIIKRNKRLHEVEGIYLLAFLFQNSFLHCLCVLVQHHKSWCGYFVCFVFLWGNWVNKKRDSEIDWNGRIAGSKNRNGRAISISLCFVCPVIFYLGPIRPKRSKTIDQESCRQSNQKNNDKDNGG